MTLKKILSALLIGAFMISFPAANFDTPLTQTVSAKSIDKDYEKIKKNYERKRYAYERAKRNYENARRSGNSKDVRFYRAAYEAARQDYYEARGEFEQYRSYDRYERRQRYERRDRDSDYYERKY